MARASARDRPVCTAPIYSILGRPLSEPFDFFNMHPALPPTTASTLDHHSLVDICLLDSTVVTDRNTLVEIVNHSSARGKVRLY
jgi:hypothetical protein